MAAGQAVLKLKARNAAAHLRDDLGEASAASAIKRFQAHLKSPYLC